jgi:16S rRNA (uracil1498-N3)-methyltransferase
LEYQALLGGSDDRRQGEFIDASSSKSAFILCPDVKRFPLSLDAFRESAVPRYEFDAPRLFVDQPLQAGGEFALAREQANYLVNVLRLGQNDTILVFNGLDGEWRARLARPSPKTAILQVEAQTRPQQGARDIHYLFAPLKHARLDYMVQKAVEMGAHRLQPVITRRTQASRVNLARMRANAIEASEQCGILALPEIAETIALAKLLDDWPADRLLVFCDEDAPVANPFSTLASALPAGRPLALLVGPEGGFDPAERAHIGRLPQSVAISLGPRILRADTAAVAALAVLQAVAGDWR